MGDEDDYGEEDGEGYARAQEAEYDFMWNNRISQLVWLARLFLS
jgi:hypothetical protein